MANFDPSKIQAVPAAMGMAVTGKNRAKRSSENYFAAGVSLRRALGGLTHP
jgi:hypothetical protein